MADETVASPPRGLAPKPPPRKRDWSWRSESFRALVYQVLALAAVAFALWYLASNTFANMQARGIRSGFDFLGQPAGCARKSNPVCIPRARMFANVLFARYQTENPIRKTATSWKTRPRKAWLRQLNCRDRPRFMRLGSVPGLQR